MRELTVCSVVFRDEAYLDAHRRLAHALNPGTAFDWLVVANQPAEPYAWRGPVRVVEGVPPQPDPRGTKRARSYHHAAALARALPHLGNARWVLFLDPDCFLLPDRWVERVLGHMERERLACFGVPYHPRTTIKLRGVPCAVCLFVDLERVPREALRFTPERSAAPPAVHPLVRRALSAVGEAGRLAIGTSQDTGIELYERLRTGELPAEAVTPVLTRAHLPAEAHSPRALALDRLLPDRFAYVPSRPGAWVERGLGDPALEGFEEFVWRGAPFALHLRPTVKGADRGALDLNALVRALGRGAGAVSTPSPGGPGPSPTAAASSPRGG